MDLESLWWCIILAIWGILKADHTHSQACADDRFHGDMGTGMILRPQIIIALQTALISLHTGPRSSNDVAHHHCRRTGCTAGAGKHPNGIVRNDRLLRLIFSRRSMTSRRCLIVMLTQDKDNVVRIQTFHGKLRRRLLFTRAKVISPLKTKDFPFAKVFPIKIVNGQNIQSCRRLRRSQRCGWSR